MVKIYGNREKDLYNMPTSQICTSLKIDLTTNHYILTAGEECLDVFLITEKTPKFMQNIQKFRFNKIRFNAITNFQLSGLKFVVIGSSCSKLFFFKFQSNGTLEKLNVFTGIHQKAITSLAFITKKSTLITGSSDFCVRMINLAYEDNAIKPSVSKVFLAHCAGISCIEYFEKAELLVSASLDQTVITWSTSSGKRDKCIKWDCDWISCLKIFENDGKLKAFCGSGNKGIAVFDLGNGGRDENYDYLNGFFNGWISFIEYYKEWEMFLVCEGKGRIILIDSGHKKRILNFEEPESDISSAYLMKNPKKEESFLLLVMNFDGKIKYLEFPMQKK